jgi:hypothetical protein
MAGTVRMQVYLNKDSVLPETWVVDGVAGVDIRHASPPWTTILWLKEGTLEIQVAGLEAWVTAGHDKEFGELLCFRVAGATAK